MRVIHFASRWDLALAAGAVLLAACAALVTAERGFAQEPLPSPMSAPWTVPANDSSSDWAAAARDAMRQGGAAGQPVGPPVYFQYQLDPEQADCEAGETTKLSGNVYDSNFNPVADGTVIDFAVSPPATASPPSRTITFGIELSTIITPGLGTLDDIEVIVTSGDTLEEHVYIDCLGLGEDGRITGTVTTALGAPIAGVQVSAQGTRFQDSNSGFTAADGTYEITALEAGYYNVTADVFGFVGEELPSPVFVSTDSITRPVDFTLDAAGQVSGRVLSGATPVVGMPVGAATPGFDGPGGFTSTDVNGNYTIGDLAPGDYKIVAFGSDTHADQWYNGVYSPNTATILNVNVGQTIANINFNLPVGGRIAGVVLDPFGAPLADAEVNVTQAECCNGSFGYSAANGSYVVGGLPAGSYRVCARHEVYGDACYDGAYDEETATLVSVPLGGVNDGKTIDMFQYGAINGTVSGTTFGAYVRAERINCCHFGSADLPADGGYSIIDLRPGCYIVSANANGNSEWYNNRFHDQSADPVCVSPNSGVNNIDFVMNQPNPDFLEQVRNVWALPFSEFRSTAGYTLSGGELQPCDNIGATAWYRFALPEDMPGGISVFVDTNGSNYDTVAAVYTGAHVMSPPGGLVNIACEDDIGPAVLSFAGAAGATYYVQAGGKNGATGSLSLNLYCKVGASLDQDCDGDINTADNCEIAYNPVQEDMDTDGIGDICDGDPDGDGLSDEYNYGTEPLIADTDGDGCDDGEETSPAANPTFGGARDPLNYWDFFDVDDSGDIALQDTLAILGRFGTLPGDLTYDERYDRSTPNGLQPWRAAQAAGDDIGVDLSDALMNLASFGHSCEG